MTTFRNAAIAAIILAASAGFAVPQTAEGQDAHHAAQGTAAPQAGAPQAGLPVQDEDDAGAFGPGMMGPGMRGGGAFGPGFMGQGMMGQGWAGRGGTAPMVQMMQGMTQMMQGMMQMMQGAGWHGEQYGAVPGAMMDRRLAAVKAQLGITDAQLPQWNAFADAMRARVTAMQAMRSQMMQQGAAASWPDRLARHEQRLSAHLDAMKAMEGPTRALWDALSDEQRRKAQTLMPGPMGMMGRAVWD